MYKKIILSVALSSTLFGCAKTFTTDCSTSSKSFSKDVSPLIASSCSNQQGCHAKGSNQGCGPLTTYAQISNNKSSIRSSVSSGSMHQNGNLSSAQKNTIIFWIDAGAAND